MLTIRPYDPDRDARAAGILIADTFFEFNLDGFTAEEADALLGPYLYARSDDPLHQKLIASVIDAPIVWAAEEAGDLVGVLRGRPGRLHSLFVAAEHHRRGIGRRLMDRFEEQCRAAGCRAITLAATPYAVPFYQRLGYRKSTGPRTMTIFGVPGFTTQPMKKRLG